jgi:hypothetical protein
VKITIRRCTDEAYETTDDRGTKTGAVEVVLDNEAPVREVDAAFGTNMGAFTAWAVREA